MNTYYKTGGVYRRIVGIFQNQSGTWKPLVKAFVKQGGVWSPAFEYFSPTLTIGNSGTNYGFQNAAYGSVSPQGFKSSAFATRTITELEYSTSLTALFFAMQGSGIVNTDAEFLEIEVNGTIFARGDAVYDAGGGLGNTWRWNGVGSNPIGTSGDIPITVRFL